MKIESKHVLITGGAVRVGREISHQLASRGARLTLHYRSSKEAAERFAGELQKKGVQAQLAQADLKSIPEIKTMFETAVKTFGPVDILINSASTFYPTPAETCSLEQWDDLLQTNLRGQFFVAQEFKKQIETGVIINIADVQRPVKMHAPYCASKAGLHALTQSLALEWAPSFRVNAISPGPILFPESYSEEKKQKSIERTLLKRKGAPSDIANACQFLIENDYITGAEIVVDGGRSLV